MAPTLSPGTIGMRCRDIAPSIAFYRLLLGDEVAATVHQDDVGGTSHTAWFSLHDGGRLVLTDDAHAHLPLGQGCAHLLTDDPAVEEVRLRGLGITPLVATHRTAGGYAMVLADPDGNEIVIGTPEQLPGQGTRLPF